MGQAEIQEAARPSPPGNALDRPHFAARSGVVCPLADGGAAWLRDGSCMSREAHVQFCESLGVRFPGATHLVMGFQHRTEAERFLKEFRERLAKFGFEVHPNKTRLIEFGRFAARNRKQRGEGKPETFTFLGFTHYCGQRHKSGTFTVCRITAKSEWLRNSKPSRLSFNAGCIIAWPKSVHGSGRLCWVITNTTQSPGTRLSYASLSFACAGSGRVFWSAAASAPRCGGSVLPQS